MSSFILRLLPIALLCYFFYSSREKITDIGYEARNIAFEYKATIEIQEIVKILRLSLVNDPRPPRDLLEFLKDHSRTKNPSRGLDPWGENYSLLETYGQELKVLSCGPDRECGTDDDIETIVRTEDGLLAGDGANVDAIEKKLGALFGF